jgi:hypothetical protein
MAQFVGGNKEGDDTWVPHVILYKDGFCRSILGSVIGGKK